ncbi:MAG: UbiD family decarboxylase [Cellulosilyticum sp.]|nr:UbiD family decarboxylase [Cellulosilyticum sp.]
MSYRGLQDFIKILEKEGELIRIKEEVDTYLEITEITERVSKQFGPALLFEKVKGSLFPVITNIMGTPKRVEMALGITDFKALDENLERFMLSQHYMGTTNETKASFSLSRLGEVFSMKMPVKGHCQEVINNHPDLRKLPILHSWPQEERPSMALPIVMSIDSRLGRQRIGTYRIEILDKKTIGMQWKWQEEDYTQYEYYKKRGEKMPISIVLGADVMLIYAAAANLPQWMDKMSLADYLRKSPIKMVKSITNDIYVPADAEFILEGYIDFNEPLRQTGKVGEASGYYNAQGECAVCHITCVTHKKEAIYPATIIGQLQMETHFIRKAADRLLLSVIQMTAPEVVDVDFPAEGAFGGCAILSIKKRFRGQAKKVMNMIWGMEQTMCSKVVIVVDEEIKPNDYESVMARILECVMPKEDMLFSPGPLAYLDYASSVEGYGYRLGIDATCKINQLEETHTWHHLEQLKGEVFHTEEALGGIIREMAVIQEGIFKGYTIASIRKIDPQDINRVCQFYWDQEQISSKCFIVVDEKVDIQNASEVAKAILMHIDTQRDVLRIADEEGNIKVIIDATQKNVKDGHYRACLAEVEMSEMIKGMVTSKWETYGL